MATRRPAGPEDTAAHGHHWKEADRVAHFAARMDQRAAEREAQFALLARLLPFGTDDAFHFLDVGAGYGAVAESLLRKFPAAQATLLDLSDAMIAEGQRRLASLDGRFAYVQGDFAAGRLPDDLPGPFDAIVSSLAIHHLPPDGKRDLYADIASRLTPGGCFFNIDSVAAPDDATEDIYKRAAARAETEPPPGAPAPPPRQHHSERQPLDAHLGWLRDAGLVHVDCYWKELGIALFGGYRPGD